MRTSTGHRRWTDGRTRFVAVLSTASVVLVITGLLIALSGCGTTAPEVSDRESGSGTSADVLSDVTDVEVFRNIDGYPNVARFCVDDLAFASTSGYSTSVGERSPSLLRVPEWDGRCGAR